MEVVYLYAKLWNKYDANSISFFIFDGLVKELQNKWKGTIDSDIVWVCLKGNW